LVPYKLFSATLALLESKLFSTPEWFLQTTTLPYFVPLFMALVRRRVATIPISALNLAE
jgi:hypothetical protein